MLRKLLRKVFGSTQSGKHKHKCSEPDCGRVWEHANGSSYQAHFCPDCGSLQSRKYFGLERPAER